MSDTQEYEIEIEFEGSIYVTITASNAEEAKQKAQAYNPTAEEVREGVNTFTVDPWNHLED